MGKFVEYIKLIPRGLANLDKVVEGIQNRIKEELGVLPERDLEVITGRRLICSQCPYLSSKAMALGIYHTARTDEHCMHCGCEINLRTASLESNCGIEAFNEKYPSEAMELKWKAIKTRIMNTKTKNQIQIEQQVLYTLAQIVETFPQYTIAQHLVHFMRPKGETKDVYTWTDNVILNRVESYYDELKTDLLNDLTRTDD